MQAAYIEACSAKTAIRYENLSIVIMKGWGVMNAVSCHHVTISRQDVQWIVLSCHTRVCAASCTTALYPGCQKFHPQPASGRSLRLASALKYILCKRSRQWHDRSAERTTYKVLCHPLACWFGREMYDLNFRRILVDTN